ncbi:MAG: cyclically-permuted mutarotase family protein [Brevinema sp.]
MAKKIIIFVCSFLISSCGIQSTTKVEQWKIAGMLPAPSGFTESIGVAAAYTELIGDYLVVAGGANFPYAPILEGGGKEFYQDIFVYQINPDKTLELVNIGMLPKKLSGGATVSTGEEILLIGGENSTGESATIYSITLNDTMPVVKEVAQLPFTWALGGAVLKERMLYLFAGRNNKIAVNKNWVFHLDNKTITALADLPGEARIQMPYAVLEDDVYVFNGLGALTLSDNYVYNLKTDTWKKLADTTLHQKPFTVAGGAAVPLTEDALLVLGGVNKEVFDDAVTQLGVLKGEELEIFRQDYFNRSPEQFNFSRQQMVYNIKENTWKSVGEIPFYGGAGPFPLVKKDSTVWLVSGEIKAGVRVPEIQTGNISTK